MSKYRKAIAAFVAALATSAAALSDGEFSATDKYVALGGLLTVVAVFLTPNAQPE